MKFEGPNKLPNLDGGKEDEECLTEVFKKLGFKVIVHSNLKANEIEHFVSGYGTDNGIKGHEKKAFILIILSHGAKDESKGDVVYGIHSEYVGVHDLQEIFYTTRCRSLAGVPKVFLIDACRGDKEEEEYLAKQGISGTRSYITDSSDFITVFASTPRNVTYVYKKDGKKKGSCFIQTLVEVIEEADENTEFNEIIREVRFRVQKKLAAEQAIIQRRNGENEDQKPKEQAPGVPTVKTQTVQAYSTLIKPYYIKRFVFLDLILKSF